MEDIHQVQCNFHKYYSHRDKNNSWITIDPSKYDKNKLNDHNSVFMCNKCYNKYINALATYETSAGAFDKILKEIGKDEGIENITTKNIIYEIVDIPDTELKKFLSELSFSVMKRKKSSKKSVKKSKIRKRKYKKRSLKCKRKNF